MVCDGTLEEMVRGMTGMGIIIVVLFFRNGIMERMTCNLGSKI